MREKEYIITETQLKKLIDELDESDPKEIEKSIISRPYPQSNSWLDAALNEGNGVYNP